jgi:hypothetical protein
MAALLPLVVVIPVLQLLPQAAGAATVQTPAPPTVPPCVYNTEDFAHAFLNALSSVGVPTTPDNLEAILAWEMAEGGNWENTAKFNPLDTTYQYDGSVDFEPNPPAPVQAYKNWDDGVYATALTLTDNYNYPDSFTQSTGYNAIIQALQAGNNPDDVTNAVDNSAWGTSNATTYVGQSYNPPAPSWEGPCIGTPSVFVDPSNSLMNYFYTDGTWYSSAVATSGVASQAATLTQPNGAPTVFVEGAGNALMNYWYVPASGGWGAATVAGLGWALSAPAAVNQPNGSPSVFVEGPGGSLFNYWYIPQNGAWGVATVAPPGSVTSAPAVVAQSNGAPSVFVEGPGGSLVNYWYVPGSGTWFSHVIAGPGSTGSAAGVVNQPANGAPTVFVQTPDGAVVNYWYIPNPGIWGAGTVVGAGSATGTPAVMLQPDTAPSIFVQSPGGALLNYWYIPQGGFWGAGTVAGNGSVYSAPAVVPQSNGDPSVFVAGGNGALLNYWYIPQGGFWGAGTVAPPNSTVTTAGLLPSANMETGQSS